MTLWVSVVDRFAIKVRDNGDVSIGCETHSIDYWLENFQEIASKHNATYWERKKYLTALLNLKNGNSLFDKYRNNCKEDECKYYKDCNKCTHPEYDYFWINYGKDCSSYQKK